MFTGIITAVGKIKSATPAGDGLHLQIEVPAHYLEDFTYDSFNQMVFNQIRSVDDYSKYIDQGLLYHIPAIERTLKKRS